VRDIQRIGDVAQETADLFRHPVRDFAARAGRYDQREEDDDAHGVVETVQPQAVRPQMRHGQHGDDAETAKPESAAQTDQLSDARQQQSGDKRIGQPRETYAELFAVERPAADHIARRPGKPPRKAGRDTGERPPQQFRKPPQDKGIADIGDILEEKRPCGAVQRIGLTPAANVHRRRHGNHQTPQQQDQKHASDRNAGDHFVRSSGAEVERRGADQHTHHHHRMQADQTALEEIAVGHASPAVVVGIADDEARKDKEEIDGQIAVVDDLVGMARGMRLEKMKSHDDQRRDAAQTVEDRIMGLRVGIGGSGS